MSKPGTVIRTHKIQLLINSSDAAYKKEVKDILYGWQHKCFRSANYILTHHFIQDQLAELFYINEGIKIKLTDIHKDADGILCTSRLNTTYQLLSKYFKGELPSDIFTSLNNLLVKQYNADRAAYWKGEKSLANFKRDMPMPIKGRSLKDLALMANGRDYSFSLFKLPFRTLLGHKTDGKSNLLACLASGEMSLCDSYIQLDKGKIYLLAIVAIPKEAHNLSDDVIAEVSLSVEYPLTVSIGKYKYCIGNKEEFLYRRLAIQAACNRAKQATGYTRGGHGLSRKFKAVHKLRDTEKNYVESRLHLYSRRLIELCVKHNAGALLLTQQQDKEAVARQDSFLLRNWSYGQLKEKIEYKAQKAGISVIVE